MMHVSDVSEEDVKVVVQLLRNLKQHAALDILMPY